MEESRSVGRSAGRLVHVLRVFRFFFFRLPYSHEKLRESRQRRNARLDLCKISRDKNCESWSES